MSSNLVPIKLPSGTVVELSPYAAVLYNVVGREKTKDGLIPQFYKWDTSLEYYDNFDVKGAIQELANKGLFTTGGAMALPKQRSVLGSAIRCVGDMCGFDMGPKLVGQYNRKNSRKNSRKNRKNSRKNGRKNSRKNNRSSRL